MGTIDRSMLAMEDSKSEKQVALAAGCQANLEELAKLTRTYYLAMESFMTSLAPHVRQTLKGLAYSKILQEKKKDGFYSAFRDMASGKYYIAHNNARIEEYGSLQDLMEAKNPLLFNLPTSCTNYYMAVYKGFLYYYHGKQVVKYELARKNIVQTLALNAYEGIGMSGAESTVEVLFDSYTLLLWLLYSDEHKKLCLALLDPDTLTIKDGTEIKDFSLSSVASVFLFNNCLYFSTNIKANIVDKLYNIKTRTLESSNIQFLHHGSNKFYGPLQYLHDTNRLLSSGYYNLALLGP